VSWRRPPTSTSTGGRRRLSSLPTDLGSKVTLSGGMLPMAGVGDPVGHPRRRCTPLHENRTGSPPEWSPPSPQADGRHRPATRPCYRDRPSLTPEVAGGRLGRISSSSRVPRLQPVPPVRSLNHRQTFPRSSSAPGKLQCPTLHVAHPGGRFSPKPWLAAVAVVPSSPRPSCVASPCSDRG